MFQHAAYELRVKERTTVQRARGALLVHLSACDGFIQLTGIRLEPTKFIPNLCPVRIIDAFNMLP
ncbi:MAG: hypothetical protein CBC48_13370 [bacterium TMED88]|nr:hypothetical protein [Deltaproteobacteria bacterium]OUV28361.1 MAG: hypothetical protein CBC48_13370 [bacterium TMED88]